MSDITKCRDNKCPSKNSCYRFTSKAGDFQSYFMESPRKDGEDRCKYYITRSNI